MDHSNLQIYNTLGRELQTFHPVTPGRITMYQCGPTVYWNQHIGNMRAMTISDLVFRSLHFLYPDTDIIFVRNYTDVGHLTGDNIGDADTGEDKMDKASRREGLSPDQIADKYIKQFDDDVASLNCLPPTHTVRATHYIDQMIQLTQKLLDGGFAYTTPLAIYFDISKKSDYTKLSNQDMSKLLSGHGHGDAEDENKKNPGDFALWFFRTGQHANALQYWPSPFQSPLVPDGIGFPGWHIECSAMSMHYLGSTIDIHLGGIEHVPIHHTNEIAQSECATGQQFVNYWMHNEHLNVDGGKMSKSDGTSYTLADITERGFSAMDLRYFFLQAHYRSKQNFTWEALTAAKTARERLYKKTGQLYAATLPEKELVPASTINAEQDNRYNEELGNFRVCIENDFNIPNALGWLHYIIDKGEMYFGIKNLCKMIQVADGVLGLELFKEQINNPIPSEVLRLADQRNAARLEKNWSESDRLRDEIANLGYNVLDTADGYTLEKR